jgi:hypothetical protein
MTDQSYTETVTTVSKVPGTPGPVTLRAYCDMGLIPHIRDANGRRLLRADAAGIAREVYAQRLALRGRPGHRLATA